MKSVKFCLLFLLLVIPFSAHAQRYFTGQVTDVIDGKTLVVATETDRHITIQLQFIEVPEKDQPLNDVVKDHLRKLAFDQKVAYYATGLTQSANLVLGKVFIKGVDLSQQMLRDGAAWYNLPEDRLYAQSDRDLYKNTETLAKNEKRGVWGVSGLKPTWEHRAELEAKQLEQEKLKAKLAEEEAKKKAETPQKSSRQTDEDRRKANENIRMWADVSEDAAPGGYRSTYDNGKNVTSNTSRLVMQSQDLANGESLSLDFTHRFSGKDAKKAMEDSYFFEFTLKSEKIDLSQPKGSKLVFSIGKNKYTLEFLGYKTAMVADPKDKTGKTTFKQQTLSFKMSRKDFLTFIQANEVDFSLGAITGSIAGMDFEVIKKVP